MTKKRFTIEIDDEKWVHILDNNTDIGQYNLCKVLNKLNEENKELKDKLFEAEKTLLIETADISDYAFDNVEKDIEELRKEIYGEGDFE